MKAQTTLITCAIVLCVSALALAPHWKARAVGVAVTAQGGSQTDPPPSVTACGSVTEYLPATASSIGTLVIGGVRFSIAAGAVVSGISVGANVCAIFCFNPSGQIVSTQGTTANGGGQAKICGVVTEFQPYSFIKIGPVKLRIGGTWIQGQTLVAPGADICLTPVFDAAGNLTSGSSVSETPGTLQIRIASLVHGSVPDQNGVDQDDVFRLPNPFILNVQQPIPAGVSVTPLNDVFPTMFTGLKPQDVYVFSNSTPNSVVRASSCSESLWDVLFQIGTTGATEGDMVTLFLQKPDGSGQIILAMFTVQGNGVVLTQLASDVSLMNITGKEFPLGTFFPFKPAANGELRTGVLVLVFSMHSARLNQCLQYVAEIKRAGGAGKTSIIHGEAVVKRMEVDGDRWNSIGIGLVTGAYGWYPSGVPCALVCQACLPPPPVQPLPGSLSGFVYCDQNNDGFKQAGEPPISGVTITLTGVDINGNVNQSTTTDANGFYLFKDLMPGVYKITETQPANTFDGKDTIGSLGGDTLNDMFANIPLPSLAQGTDYNFGENCPSSTPTPTPTPTPPGTPTPTPTVTPTPPMPMKCDSICWRSTLYLLNNWRYWPGGTVLAAGFNANNPIGVQNSVNTIRLILQGGLSAQQRLNREFVTAQLSMNLSGGSGSPVVFNVFWSPLHCSQITFAPFTLSNGVTFTDDSLLDTLMNQTVQAIRDNRQQDFDELANVWALLNGTCGY